MCLYPRLITNRKYVSNKKNGGNIPPVKDIRVTKVPVGCGKCMECRKKKAREWAVRMQEEIRHDKRGKFVTLTFKDEELVKLENSIRKLSGYNLDNAVATKAIRRFLERWRKREGTSVKHWLITELGQTSTERIHIHGIIWTDDVQGIEKAWEQYGTVWVGDYVNEKTVNYIVKYLSKQDEKHPEYIAKICTSAGIGKGYENRIDYQNNKYNGKKTQEKYITRQGVKLGLPIYYRNKLYSEDEREKLWLQKLDEQVRWVNGRKVDISNGEDDYYAVLQEERKKNKILGYGDDEKNWEKRKYEDERRNMKKLERLKKIYGVSDGLTVGAKKG